MRGRAFAVALAAAVALGGCAFFRPVPAPADRVVLQATLSDPDWVERTRAHLAGMEPGPEGFRAFVGEVRRAVEARDALDGWLARVEDGGRDDAEETRDLWSLLVRRYAVVRYGDAAVQVLRELIRRPTVRDAGGPPAGEIAAFRDMDTLLRNLADRQRLGYRNYDFHLFSVRTGVGPDPVTVLTHGDVVPADPARWTQPPFEGVVAQGAVWGRGALDDKGPIAAHIFAMRALLDAGALPDRDVELLIGTAEETSWDGIRAYLRSNPAPTTCYVADAEFPVIVGEKGALNFTVEGVRRAPEAAGESSQYFLERFEAGTAANVVAAEARATVRIRSVRAGEAPDAAVQRALARFRETGAEVDLGYLLDGDRLHLTARGKPAHGAKPWEGWNAATYLLSFLRDHLGMGAADLGDLGAWVVEAVGLELDGTSLGIALDHEEMGETSVNLGLVAIGAPGEPESATLNIRWPVGRTVAETVATVRAGLARWEAERGARFKTRTAYEFDPVLVDAASPTVGALIASWRAVTGRDEGPRTIAGTTYAKAIPGAVSFGPNYEGSGLAIHGDDERLPIEHLERLVEVYTEALARLAAPSDPAGGRR